MKIKKIVIALAFVFVSGKIFSQQNATIEKYAETPYPVGNIAFNDKDEMIYSNHPFFAPEVRVMHYNPVTKVSTPFPNEKWNTRRKTDDMFFDDVLGIRNDSKGVVWILDMGLKTGVTPKLVGWNTKTNQLERIYYIPAPASLHTSQLNDFVIDEKREVVVIADEEIGNKGDGSKAALVILDLKTGVTRRVLEGHESTIPENLPIISDGKPLNIPGTNKPILVGADGITLDKDNEWLYYAPLNGTSVYRIKMDDLLSASDIDKKVERYSDKRNNGGLSIDIENNLYLTYVGDKAIGIIPADTKKQKIYAQDNQLIWPDGVTYSRDGYMYTSAAQLTLAKIFNDGKEGTTKPYYIFRFKPLKKGIWGR